MRTRSENVSLINGLYGFNQLFLAQTVGFKGFSSIHYTDDQLQQIADMQLAYEEELMTLTKEK